MFWLVLHREWVDLDALQADLIPATTPAKFLEALESLCWPSLIEQQFGKYTQQPVVMEYASDRLIDEICGEITSQVRLSLFQSHILIQATAAHLVRKFGNLANIQVSQKLEFSIAGEQQFVQALPWRDELGLDWLIVVVLPESDFMEHIHANARSTILLCLAAFFSSMYMASLTSRWLATPILQLSKASKQITEEISSKALKLLPLYPGCLKLVKLRN